MQAEWFQCPAGLGLFFPLRGPVPPAVGGDSPDGCGWCCVWIGPHGPQVILKCSSYDVVWTKESRCSKAILKGCLGRLVESELRVRSDLRKWVEDLGLGVLHRMLGTCCCVFALRSPILEPSQTGFQPPSQAMRGAKRQAPSQEPSQAPSQEPSQEPSRSQDQRESKHIHPFLSQVKSVHNPFSEVGIREFGGGGLQGLRVWNQMSILHRAQSGGFEISGCEVAFGISGYRALESAS